MHLSQVLAFTLPTSVLRGRFCIRPEADQALINNPVFVQLLPLLSPVLPVQLDENEHTRGLDHQARPSYSLRIYHSLCTLLCTRLSVPYGVLDYQARKEATRRVMLLVLSAKLAHMRTTLVLENVHDMDSPSWRLLRFALLQLKPMMVLLTMRPIEADHKHPQLREIEAEIERAPPWDGGRRVHGGRARHKMELGGLTEVEVRQLVANTLGVVQVPPAIPRLICQKTEGVPFWVVEFALTMRDDQVLYVEADACVLAKPLSEMEIPSSVTTLITSRMDRLPNTQQLIMKVASVINAPSFERQMVLYLMQVSS